MVVVEGRFLARDVGKPTKADHAGFRYRPFGPPPRNEPRAHSCPSPAGMCRRHPTSPSSTPCRDLHGPSPGHPRDTRPSRKLPLRPSPSPPLPQRRSRPPRKDRLLFVIIPTTWWSPAASTMQGPATRRALLHGGGSGRLRPSCIAARWAARTPISPFGGRNVPPQQPGFFEERTLTPPGPPPSKHREAHYTARSPTTQLTS